MLILRNLRLNPNVWMARSRFDLVTVLDVFSHDQIHIRAHTMSQQTQLAHEMNQCLFSRDGQPIRFDSPDHAVIPGDVEMPGEEFEVGAIHINFPMNIFQ